VLRNLGSFLEVTSNFNFASAFAPDGLFYSQYDHADGAYATDRSNTVRAIKSVALETFPENFWWNAALLNARQFEHE
jgi:hypothetical protein